MGRQGPQGLQGPTGPQVGFELVAEFELVARNMHTFRGCERAPFNMSQTIPWAKKTEFVSMCLHVRLCVCRRVRVTVMLANDSSVVMQVWHVSCKHATGPDAR